MQIVIDIPEEDYYWIKDDEDGASNYAITVRLYNAVDKGTPLPKGHGDLIDRDDVKKKYPLEIDGLDLRGNNQGLHTAMDDTPTIIPADKES